MFLVSYIWIIECSVAHSETPRALEYRTNFKIERHGLYTRRARKMHENYSLRLFLLNIKYLAHFIPQLQPCLFTQERRPIARMSWKWEMKFWRSTAAPWKMQLITKSFSTYIRYMILLISISISILRIYVYSLPCSLSNVFRHSSI